MDVSITNRQRAKWVNRRLLKQMTAALLADLEIENVELGIVLVAAPEMATLNEKYLRHRGSTDVIAFDYGVGVAPSRGFPPNNSRQENRPKPELRTVHGEVFICVDMAVSQAKKFRTGWQSEITRYLVHGILHLLGYDDRRAAGRRKMKREENRRVRELSRRFALSKLGSNSKLAGWSRKVCSPAGVPVS